MKVKQIVGLILVAAGLIAVVIRGVTYTKETHEAQFGPIELSVKEKKRVDIPLWAGVILIALGAGVLAVQGRGKTDS